MAKVDALILNVYPTLQKGIVNRITEPLAGDDLIPTFQLILRHLQKNILAFLIKLYW